jgi:hypothetical protein
MILGIRKLSFVFLTLTFMGCGIRQESHSSLAGHSEAAVQGNSAVTQTLTCVASQLDGCYFYKSLIHRDSSTMPGVYFACANNNKNGLCVYWGQVRLVDDVCIKVNPLSCKFWNTPNMDLACVRRNSLNQCTLWGESMYSVDFEHKPIPNPIDRGACLEYFDRHCIRWETDVDEPLPAERK